MVDVDRDALLMKALMVGVDQQEQIAKIREQNARQRAQIEQQLQRIADLEALIDQLREELGKNSSALSKPPCSDGASQREENRAKRKRRDKRRRRRGG